LRQEYKEKVQSYFKKNNDWILLRNRF
jgi:hypothetical protein